MKQNKLLFYIALTITCVSSVLVVIGALFKIMHWPWANEMLIAGMLTQSLIIIVYFIDIAMTPIPNKWSWIVGSLFNPIGAAIIYIANKNDLKEIQENKENQTK